MKRDNIFVSDCGNYIAIRIPGFQPSFDVWKHDGSEFWEGTKYVESPDKKRCYSPRSVHTEEFARPRKAVGSWSNLGHRCRNGEWREAFRLGLYDLDTKESLEASFHAAISSLAPQFNARRQRHEGD